MVLELSFLNVILVVSLFPSQKEYSIRFYCPCECINWKADLQKDWLNHAGVQSCTDKWVLTARHLLSFLVHMSLSSVHNELKAAEYKHVIYLSGTSAICRKSSSSSCVFIHVSLFSSIKRLCHAFTRWKTLQGSPPIQGFQHWWIKQVSLNIRNHSAAELETPKVQKVTGVWFNKQNWLVDGSPPYACMKNKHEVGHTNWIFLKSFTLALLDRNTQNPGFEKMPFVLQFF